MATRKTSTRHKATTKSSTRRYSPAASDDVERALHREKLGTLKRGKQGHGGAVTSRAQAIAIGLSEARKEGKKVPPPPRRRRQSAAKR